MMVEAIRDSLRLGLEVLSTAVIVFDGARNVVYVNPAAENLFQVSRNIMVGHRLEEVFTDYGTLQTAIAYAERDRSSYTQHDVSLAASSAVNIQRMQLIATVTPFDLSTDSGFLVELTPLSQRLRISREERLHDQSLANRELIRNLAHEIKNPLGALRGAAQLLERELERPALREYTQVIMKEADRLQSLMDRLLTPHRLPQPTALNVHEVMERVRSLIIAEFPAVKIQRDYDTSLPHITADREQLIQAVLNIARNAAQAMQGQGNLSLRTRIARRITIAKQLYRLVILLEIIDDGPGIAEDIRDRIFFPLVSGREGGSGLGLTIAQTFVNQHHGSIEVDSQAGRTCFAILLPLRETLIPSPAAPAETKH